LASLSLSPSLLSAALCRVHYSIFRSWPASQRYSYYSFGGLPILLLSSCQKKQNWRSCVVPFRFFLLFLRQETEQQHFTDAFVQDYRYGEIEMTVHESPGAQHVSVAPAAASPLPCISLFRPVAHSRRSDSSSSSSSLINIFRDSDDLSCPLLPPPFLFGQLLVLAAGSRAQQPTDSQHTQHLTWSIITYACM
jgi:hypothetical protein